LSGGVGAVVGSAVGSSVGSVVGSTAGSVLSGAAGGVAAGGVGYVAGSLITGQDMTWQGAGEAMAFGGVMGGLGGALSAKASTSSECSFTGDTPVLLADGSTLSISSVAAGASVTATDPGTGQTSSQTVTAVWPHQDQIWDVTLADGTLIHTTANHPWWDVTTRTWTRTDHLASGDELATSSGGTITISKIEETDQTQTTYNLTVTGPHTYYVGLDNLLVHNCPNASGMTQEQLASKTHLS